MYLSSVPCVNSVLVRETHLHKHHSFAVPQLFVYPELSHRHYDLGPYVRVTSNFNGRDFLN